ncbi:unnamed protein product [Prunus brigantina]
MRTIKFKMRNPSQMVLANALMGLKCQKLALKLSSSSTVCNELNGLSLVDVGIGQNYGKCDADEHIMDVNFSGKTSLTSESGNLLTAENAHDIVASVSMDVLASVHHDCLRGHTNLTSKQRL